MFNVTTAGRRGTARMIAAITAGALTLAMTFTLGASPVAAHGCGTADHTIGEFPGVEIHYYEGHYTSGNSYFARWHEVGIGGDEWTSTFCGCVNPSLPCYNLLADTPGQVHVH